MPGADPRVEFEIGGTWTDVTADLMKEAGIRHSRGRRNEGARVDPGSLSLTLRSPNGRYSNRNPLSPNFGQLGLNTPVRVSTYAGETVLDVPRETAGRATTPDVAALDITGDIDVRADLAPQTWTGDYVNGSFEIMGKYNLSLNQRSWRMLVTENGRLHFGWSTTGANLLEWNSTISLPFGPGRRGAVRVTLDVDNGLGGYTLTWYTAPTLAGPWTQLDQRVTTSGTTSIFNSTTALEIGDISDQGFEHLTGRVYAAEIRNGINGPLVASPDFTAQAPGATSFVDSAGRTWTVAGGASITDRRIRTVQELSEGMLRWHRSGHHVVAPVEAAGIMRRLGAGSDALASTLRRRIPSEPSCVAYWPLEEGEDATQAYSPIPGVSPLRVTGFDFAADDSLVGSSALPQLVGGASITMEARIPPHTATGAWMVTYVYKFPSAPATATEILEATMATGSVRRITVTLDAGGATVTLKGYDSAGDEVLSFFVNTTSFYGTWNRLELLARTSGSDVTYHLGWIDVSGGGWFATQTLTSATAGTVHRINTRWGASGDGMRIGHLGVFNSSDTLIYQDADDGFQGEVAASRFLRLTAEEDVPASLLGNISDTMQMGPQRPATLLTLLGEAEESDGGVLLESRDRLALAYRTRASMYNQTPALTVSYGQLTQPFEPVEGDTPRNDVTVQRVGGSSARVVLETGPLSVADVGRYGDNVPLSLFHDGQPEQIAAWFMSLSTWDQERYPAVRILLHKYPELIAQVTALDVGDIVRITDLPAHLPPGPLDLMVEGYEEDINPLEWVVTLVCSPAGPWTVGVLEDPVLGRLDTDGAVLGAAVTSSDTALEVHTDTLVGPRWIDSAGYASQFPFDVKFGGERATVSAITNRSDTFGRSVSNGWGTSSSGQAWAETGGAAADRSVNGARGVITLNPSVSTVRHQRLVSTLVADCEVRVRMSVSAVATGASAIPAVLLRYVDTSTYYRARVHFGTGGSMFVSISRDTTQIGISQSLPYTYTPGAEFEVRVRLVGHTIQMRVWPVGTAEPKTWDHTETVVTNTIAAGGIGLTGSAFAGLTNVGLQLLYDSFEVVTPQLMTVTRSVNGISKSHAAGTPVSLQTPLRLAL